MTTHVTIVSFATGGVVEAAIFLRTTKICNIPNGLVFPPLRQMAVTTVIAQTNLIKPNFGVQQTRISF